MQPQLEKIDPAFGNSFTLRSFIGHSEKEMARWHFHLEYEKVFSSGGKGKRHIAQHTSHYENGDLFFLGPDFPHFGFTERIEPGEIGIVAQMGQDFLGSQFFSLPEMKGISALFEKSRTGIVFHGQTNCHVGGLLMSMLEMEPFSRLMTLLRALQISAQSEEYTLLNVQGFSVEVNNRHMERMNAIYRYVEDNFAGDLRLDQAAAAVNLSVPAFYRYFRKLTNKTFTQLVNEVRIAHAVQILRESHLPISEICFACGFTNLSYFNKSFHTITGLSPRAYRDAGKKLIIDR